MDSNSSVTVGRKKRGNSWLIVLLFVLGVAIIGLVVAIVVVNINNGNTCGENCENSEEAEVEDETDEEDDEYPEVWEKTPEEYIENLEIILSQPLSDKDRAEHYFNGAVDLWYFEPSSDNKYIGRILESLQKVEELNPTSESAWWISYIEDQRGNSEVAEKYFNISQEREELEEAE